MNLKTGLYIEILRFPEVILSEYELDMYYTLSESYKLKKIIDQIKNI